MAIEIRPATVFEDVKTVLARVPSAQMIVVRGAMAIALIIPVALILAVCIDGWAQSVCRPALTILLIAAVLIWATFISASYRANHFALMAVLTTLAAWNDAEFCRERLGRGPLGTVAPDRLNVNGSSLAAGHPFGATGGRVVGTLAKLLAEKKAETGQPARLSRRTLRTPPR